MRYFLQRYSVVILGLGILLVCLMWISLSPRGRSLTDQFFDPIRTTDSRQEVVIVGIDDKSLQTLGSWPWDRSVFARVNEVLIRAKVKSIAYDILFLEARKGDEAFASSLTTSPVPILLASKRNNSTYLESLFVKVSTSTYPALANVDPDIDGKIRKYPASVPINGTCLEGLALRTFELYLRSVQATCKETTSYFRYPSTITTYSLSDILDGTVTESKLAGKVIFIGSTSLDLEDHFLSLQGNKVPGVYVHASIFTSLLNSVSDVATSDFITGFSIALLLILTLLLLYTIERLILQVVSIVLLLISSIIVSFVFFSYGKILPVPWFLTTIIGTSIYIILVRFIQERKESRYIQSLFSKYVHKDVLHELVKSTTPFRLGGERKDVAILFSDLRGFTTLSEGVTAEELMSTLNEYFSAMTPQILEEKGTIDKFIGDAIMAFWNAPLSIPNYVTHAVASAIRMHDALLVFNKSHHTTLAMGVGIHCGEVIVGNVGGKDRVNYTILGDAVNLTSRLEGLTKKYGVCTIVTEDVVKAVVDDLYQFRLLDVITVKGKSIPTKIYEVRKRTDWDNGLITTYESAHEYYRKGMLDEAAELFRKYSDDEPSKLMIERIEIVRNQLDWDGIWRFDEK